MHVLALLDSWCPNRLAKIGAVKFLKLFVFFGSKEFRANSSLSACLSFPSLPYWLFAGPEERKWEGVLPESCSSALVLFVRSDTLQVR